MGATQQMADIVRRLYPYTGHIEDRNIKYLLQQILKEIDNINDRLDDLESAIRGGISE